MLVTYDPKLNVAYIRFSEEQRQVNSHPLTDDIIVDVDRDGKLYGIELLNAREQLRQKSGVLAFVNQATQERSEMPIPV
ncbi:MAG: DUF2283 domain-containing protein [Anaerolineae bacterium]